MKILLATSSFKGGGIASYAQEVIENYCEEHEVSVLIGDDSLHPITTPGVNVFRYEMKDSSSSNAAEVINLINDIIQPDIIINSCAKLMPLIIPFLKNNIKIINVSHSLRYNEADYAGQNSEYADCVIALSNYCKEYLLQKYQERLKDKIHVVSNFVEDQVECANICDLKKNKDKVTIVFNGGGTACKSPDLVFAIVKKLLKTNEQFKFYWLGLKTPPFKSIQPFKEIGDLLPIDDRLIITGRVSREESVKICNEANIFLHPSRREGCPMALLEAIRSGTITLTSDYNNACKEIIVDGYNGFVIDHKNIDAFVERIISIIKNHGNYSEIYDNSRKSFTEGFTYQVWRDNMDALLSDIKNQHANRFPTFDEKLFATYKKRQEWQSKKNQLHMMLHEYIPAALPFWKFYILNKLRK